MWLPLNIYSKWQSWWRDKTILTLKIFNHPDGRTYKRTLRLMTHNLKLFRLSLLHLGRQKTISLTILISIKLFTYEAATSHILILKIFSPSKRCIKTYSMIMHKSQIQLYPNCKLLGFVLHIVVKIKLTSIFRVLLLINFKILNRSLWPLDNRFSTQ